MDIRELLGRPVSESFKSQLAWLPHHFHYSDAAASELAQSFRLENAGDRIAVLFDKRTRHAAGEGVWTALREAGWSVIDCLVEDGLYGATPVCDDTTKAACQRKLPKVDALLAVGSGVVNDLTKWIAADAGLPYAVFATAASMNGYAAANVAPTIAGIKTLSRARAPRVVAADPRVLAASPHEMTTAGLGDLLAKPVSTADWRLNHLLFGEVYSDAIAALIDGVEPMYLDDAPAVARHEPAAIRALFEALVLSGCAMTLQGSSLPASGGEHLISHTLDMSSEIEGGTHDLHGRQVGVATIFVAAIYQELLTTTAPKFEVPVAEFDPRAWGAAAPAVEAELQKKREIMRRACARLAQPGTWESIRHSIQPSMRTPERIKQCLIDAGGAHRVSDIGCTPARFLWAVRSCAWIRSRFTSIDLALCARLIPGIEGRLVERYLT